MFETIVVWSSVLLFCAWLVHYLRRAARHRAAHSAPREGTFLASIGITAHLRDFYRLAVTLEAEGTELYLRLSEAAEDPGTKTLCADLAERELAHKKLFQATLDRWRRLPPSRSDWPVLLEGARKAGLFSDPPPRGAGEKELARYALLQEMLSAKFYASFEHAFPDAWRREKIGALVAEEQAHAERLRAAYPNL